MQRLRSSGTSVLTSVAVPQLKKKVLNSWSAVQDTYFSTKDTFERHKVVFTISTSIASVATAWFGYTLRAYHQSKVDNKLDSIEKSLKSKNHIEQAELKKVLNSALFSTEACIATAGTAFVIGYGLGWRGGRWFATRKFRKEQMKLLAQMNPKRSKFTGKFLFLRRPFSRLRGAENSVITSGAMQKAAATTKNSEGEIAVKTSGIMQKSAHFTQNSEATHQSC